MFVKYQHVRAVVIVVVVLGVAAGAVYGVRSCTTDTSPTIDAPPPPTAAKPTAPAAEPTTPAAPAPAAEPTTPAQKVMRLASGEAGKKKHKDAMGKTFPWKVNLYDDDQDGRWERAKVDRDRDGTWDEKWTFKEGYWEKSNGELRWSGQAWVKASLVAGLKQAPPAAAVDPVAPAAAASPAAPAASPAKAEHADLVRVILKDRASGKKRKDHFGGAGPKVNLYDDDQDGRWDRAKLDRDRDNSWDEKWTRKGEQVERKDTTSGKVRVFADGAWVDKK